VKYSKAIANSARGASWFKRIIPYTFTTVFLLGEFIYYAAEYNFKRAVVFMLQNALAAEAKLHGLTEQAIQGSIGLYALFAAIHAFFLIYYMVYAWQTLLFNLAGLETYALTHWIIGVYTFAITEMWFYAWQNGGEFFIPLVDGVLFFVLNLPEFLSSITVF